MNNLTSLPPVIKDTVAPKRSYNKGVPKTFEWTEPLYLTKLVELLGSPGKAGQKRGRTSSFISSNLRKNRTQLANELAARHVYEQLCPPLKRYRN